MGDGNQGAKDTRRAVDIVRNQGLEASDILRQLAQEIPGQLMSGEVTGGMSMQDFVLQMLSDPMTYNDDLKSRIVNSMGASALDAQDLEQKQGANRAEMLGIGRSSAGGQGLAEMAGIRAAGRQAGAINQVETDAAKQRIPDLMNAANTALGFLQAYFNPTKELASGLNATSSAILGSGQLSGQLYQNSAGPGDLALGLVGQAGGGLITGGLDKLFG